MLDAIVPLYLQHLKDQTKRRDNSSAAKLETTAITNLAVTIKALITGAETLARYVYFQYNTCFFNLCANIDSACSL